MSRWYIIANRLIDIALVLVGLAALSLAPRILNQIVGAN